MLERRGMKPGGKLTGLPYQSKGRGSEIMPGRFPWAILWLRVINSLHLLIQRLE